MAQDFYTPISTNECVGLFQGRDLVAPTAMVVPLLTFAPPDGCVIHCLARVAAVDLTATKGAAFIHSATFRYWGGSLAPIGASTNVSTHRTDPSWDISVQWTGSRIQLVAIPDVALTTRWTWRLECSFAPIADPTLSAELASLALPVF